MNNIMDTLITDRTQADVDRAKYLNSLWDPTANRWTGTSQEWAEWAAGPRGAYGFNDMNRVTQAVAYLIGELEALGYSVDTGDVTPAYNIRVSIDPAGGGIASGAGVFYEGDTATVAAQAGDKYNFVGWMESGEIVSTNLVYTFTVEHSRNLTAVFALKQFRVSVSVDPSGAGEATGAGTYDIDTEVTVAATAGDGYAFTRWTENGETVAEGPEYTFILTENRALSAVMTKTHIISVTANDTDGGTVSGSGTYLDGQTVTVAAVAGDGYEFTGWQENGITVSEDAVYSFSATADRELVALFAKIYAITLLVDPAGSGTASGGGTYLDGQQATVTAAPGSGNRFVAWEVNGEQASTNQTYTFTVTGDRTLTAVFEAIPVYTITAIIDPAGSGTVTGAGQYQEGETCTLVATVAKGYAFVGWQEDGVTVSTNESYSFPVTGNRMLVSLFEVYSRLPAGYTEIEYLHSSGNVGFNTGVSVNFKTSKILLDIMIESAPSGYSNVINSANDPTNGRLNCFLSNGTNSIWFGFDGGTNTNISMSLSNKRLTIDWSFPEKTFKIGSTTKSFSGTTVTNGGTIIILNNSGAAPTCKLYSFKIYNSSTLVKDYVPFVDSTGKIGLYDLVGGAPIYDINTGSGTLTAGPAV